MQENKKPTSYPSKDKPWLKYYSEEAIHAPLPECSVYEYLWEHNKNHLDDVALNYFDRKITYGELFENIERAAKAFVALGVEQGEIVVMATVTTPETIYAFYGLNRISAVANMVDPRTSVEGIREYVAEVKARRVLTIDVAYPKIEKAIAHEAQVEQVIVVSPADSLLQPKKMLFLANAYCRGKVPRLSRKCIRWGQFLDKGSSKEWRVEIGEQGTKTKDQRPGDACCVIVHTGGTTGMPKGVMLSNQNLNVMALQYRMLGVEFTREQNFLNIMPPFIAYGIVLGIHMPLVLGLNDVLIPQFDPERFADLIRKYRPAHLLGVPTHFDKLRTSLKMKKYSLDFFQSAGAGGDAITETFEREINQFLREHDSQYDIAKGYGMTEISSAATACRGTVNKFQSVGVPHVKTTVSIFEPGTDEELPYGSHGEICMTAPTVMLGYYGKERETEEVLQMHHDGKRWIHSGDLGYMDKDGFVFVEGRIKRLIIRYDGFKVFPSLIENAVMELGIIKECCVVGKRDREHAQGMLPIIYAVKKDDCLSVGKVTDEEMVDKVFNICKEKLPEYAQPAECRFIDELPLTPVGKVDYRRLEAETE